MRASFFFLLCKWYQDFQFAFLWAFFFIFNFRKGRKEKREGVRGKRLKNYRDRKFQHLFIHEFSVRCALSGITASEESQAEDKDASSVLAEWTPRKAGLWAPQGLITAVFPLLTGPGPSSFSTSVQITCRIPEKRNPRQYLPVYTMSHCVL